METRTIHESITLNAKPEQVFETFLDEKQHSRLIGASAKIDRKIGGKFSLWDGSISGTTVSLEKNKKITQRWRESDWEDGHFSTVEFEFFPTKGGTRLVLIHKGVPEDHYEKIKDGWKQFYLEPLKEFFKK